jgi:hypothetical protein
MPPSVPEGGGGSVMDSARAGAAQRSAKAKRTSDTAFAKFTKREEKRFEKTWRGKTWDEENIEEKFEEKIEKNIIETTFPYS